MFLVSATTVFAQNARAIYEYKFKIDSTKMDSIKTEWMYLDITKEGSKYYSKKSFDSDSIVAESIRTQLASGIKDISISRNSNRGDVNFKVLKTYPDLQTSLETRIGNDNFKVLEDRAIEWKIYPEKLKIGEFHAQKAMADFGGRQWIVWFTTEIPFQDGPYKFYGLPGLIVKAEDKTGSHIMELKALKKNYTIFSNDVRLPEGKELPLLGKKPIEVNRKQYLQKLAEYQKDPVQSMREMLNRPNSKIVVKIQGVEYSDPKDILRQYEKTMRHEMQKTNNKIELTP